MSKVAIIIGTRPEAIKMAPLVVAYQKSGLFELTVVSTGQHREMLHPILDWFGIHADVDLELMKPDQSLASLSAAGLNALEAVFRKQKPDAVLVQGDTTTAFMAALAAFYQKVPVAHVEAGLRTYQKFSPWPEEVNRQLITRIADLHFAPTELNRASLLQEGIDQSVIFVTGNTVIDALLYSAAKIEREPIVPRGLQVIFTGTRKNDRMVLVTAHRRENLGEGFIAICNAILRLARQCPDVVFVYPVHMNPHVREVVFSKLGGVENIHLTAPAGYPEFISLMKRSYLILTDSGGVQEEAPSLGKPVLVMRNTTERPEGVNAGTVRLVGTDENELFEAAYRLLSSSTAYQAMTAVANPYGDGNAAARIVDILSNRIASRTK
jgi:UDP-N-acetylglucosamine 2-epimerase (non-hydrolysing)